MNYQEFENKVKSMTAHDIIMAMVEGLRSPRTEIDMKTFGEIKDGICFGCAATNAILHIMDAKEEEVKDHIRTAQDWNNCPSIITQFERAIDNLRRGWWGRYNEYAKACGFALISSVPGHRLPYLKDDYTEAQLQEYEKLAKYQLTA